MTLNRWDPLKDLLNFQEKLHRMVHHQADPRVKCEGYWCPVVDILETPDAYIFRAELPGVGRENISVELRNNQLILAGQRPIEPDPQFAAYHRIERVHGYFERSFSIPGNVDADSAQAKYVDGVLEVTLPKGDEEVERNIHIVCLG
ncbi:MAG: Hsp20/alpha crystallin family protein [Desulfomonile tiedjei]|uniref:Hsp20/alpha crystallin family protein n=1 Tax=Desulfomonile tiedjei TaxID=2358 RepID=A0A9D6V4X8_9BACT|nr:Hsp20/alpha crystallin family protein [Desulfomonile tiedjei]